VCACDNLYASSQVELRELLFNTQSKGVKGFVITRVVFMYSLPQILNCFVNLAEFDERDIER
jgi:hypothetical protein